MVQRDSRDIITPYAFQVAPELLNVPLAGPSRRTLAMAIDGLLIALLANAPSVLFGLAAAVVLFRASARSAPGGYLRRTVRLSFRVAGVVLLFVVVISGWGALRDRFRERDEERAAVNVEINGDIDASPMSALLAVGQIAALRRAGDEAEAREAAQNFADALTAAGVPPAEVREAVREVGSEVGRPWVAAAVDSVLDGMSPTPALSADSVLLPAAVAAFAEGDSAAYDSLRPHLLAAVAGDTLATLQSEIRHQKSANAGLAAQVDELEERGQPRGVKALMRGLADDLGLGFGWSSLYFTAFLALWRGQTPGKRVMRARVVRLDGRPITWWAAFERFGGYAASLATGLLGFFQIFWDANRQGIHDKIANTVVVRE